MADLTGIIEEIRKTNRLDAIDFVRNEKIKTLADTTGRNVICYYSGFLENSDHPDIAISDKDMNGFMTAVHGLDKSKGLDLIIHSPGGSVSATEAIGNYLKNEFKNDIRVFVPQLAMSGGTMLSCIGRTIFMGRHSSIGPVDPQLGGISAYNVIQEFCEAKKDILKEGKTIPYWQLTLGGYPVGFLKRCKMAVSLSQDVLFRWLDTGTMFEGLDKTTKVNRIKKIASYLNNNEHTKMHDRHIDILKAKEIGLDITDLESDQELQDAVLSVHHAFMVTFQNTTAIKIIENQVDKRFIMLNVPQR